MSTYSPSLRIELITTGDQAGTWGGTTNTNLGTLIESAIAGYTSVSITSANQALTALNGAADQSRNMTIALTTTTTANFAVYAPPAEKTYIIYNASGYAATIYNSTVLGNTTAAGAGVTVPAGKTMTVWSDGTNFSVQINHLPTLSLTTDLAIADGGTGASTAAAARTNLGLGTIATQNANSVAVTGGSVSGTSLTSNTITGGSISGITDLAVADGGTGASDAAGARSNLGLVIGTNVLAPNGNGSALTNLNASAISSGTVPVTNSGSLRLISRQQVYGSSTPNGSTISVSLPTSLFGGNTPSFVMFSAAAQVTGVTDLRYFFMCSGSSDVLANVVLGSSSDDTDQSLTGRGTAASTFVLPYSSTQNFYTLLYGATLYIHVIGYQV